ncbi:hypothetical protein Bca101_058940 [Brassica carinata]
MFLLVSCSKRNFEFLRSLLSSNSSCLKLVPVAVSSLWESELVILDGYGKELVPVSYDEELVRATATFSLTKGSEEKLRVNAGVVIDLGLFGRSLGSAKVKLS